VIDAYVNFAVIRLPTCLNSYSNYEVLPFPGSREPSADCHHSVVSLE